MTGARAHFVDPIVRGAITAIPIVFVGGAPITWSIFIVARTFWGFFIHANVKTSLGPLKYILVSPQSHRLHHSIMPEHFDVNYGEYLAIWDFLFGTMAKDSNCYPRTGVKGIERWAVESDSTARALITYWFRQTFYPFYKIGQLIGRKVARVNLICEREQDTIYLKSAQSNITNSGAQTVIAKLNDGNFQPQGGIYSG